jgi:hypothetical protein
VTPSIHSGCHQPWTVGRIPTARPSRTLRPVGPLVRVDDAASRSTHQRSVRRRVFFAVLAKDTSAAQGDCPYRHRLMRSGHPDAMNSSSEQTRGVNGAAVARAAPSRLQLRHDCSPPQRVWLAFEIPPVRAARAGRPRSPKSVAVGSVSAFRVGLLLRANSSTLSCASPLSETLPLGDADRGIARRRDHRLDRRRRILCESVDEVVVSRAGVVRSCEVFEHHPFGE